MEKTEENLRQGLEEIACAQINFENLERAFPMIKEHPFYKISKMQLDSGLKEAGYHFDTSDAICEIKSPEGEGE